MTNTHAFTDKATDYAASRPDYPSALCNTLRTQCQLSPQSRIADIGAGTGILTESLLQQRYHVTAIEPNDDMRHTCDQRLGHYTGYQSIAGSAESMVIPDHMLDLITAAQAFHWFDIERARAEFLRVLTPAGQVALIWNDRQPSDPLQQALNQLFARYGENERATQSRDRDGVDAFFRDGARQTFIWDHVHQLTLAGLTSLVYSRSYMPARGSAQSAEIEQQIKAIYHDFATDGQVSMHYQTLAIIGRPV